MQYLLHAANERHRDAHFSVQRPWVTAPLWIARDGTQPDYPPMAFARIAVPQVEPESPRRVPSQPDSPTIDGYEILETLPAGASGEVYRARENRTGGVVRAIKVFTPHPFADDEDPEPRFRSEVEALLRLQHRAVVRYVHSGVLQSRGSFYLVMEFIEGGRLRDRYLSMPLETRVKSMIEVLLGLEHVHQNKIFHRDIKPSNIMIRDSDKQAVLVDFGLAYLLGDEVDDDRTRFPLGTPGYIAPEAANDPKRSRDPKNDVYQAGATLYEILVGHLPGVPYWDLEATDPRLRDLDPVIRKALAADPAQRFPSAAAFAAELQQWVERDGRRQLATRSPVTSRLADRFLAGVKRAAVERETKDRELREQRDALAPFETTVETISCEAFAEFFDAITGHDPHLQIHMGSGQADRADQRTLVRFEYSHMNRSISFMHVGVRSDLVRLARSQLHSLTSSATATPSELLALWLVCSEGSQSPPVAVWGAVAVD